jgi:hypothetical protein
VTAHLTDADLRDFAGGVLNADDLLRADDHLSSCGQCRGRAASLTDIGRHIDQLNAQLNAHSRHLSDEELQLLAQGTLPPELKETLLLHVDDCRTCAAHVEDLRTWAAPKSRVRIAYLAVAATIALGVLIPGAIWQWRAGRPVPPPSLQGLETLGASEQTRVRAALDAGVAVLPEFMTDIASAREVLMGSPATRGDRFNLVTPVGTGIVSDRPRFEWQALDGATGYVVTVFDERSNVLARSPVVAETAWIPNAPLPRGRTYVWQVTARRGRDAMTAPIAPEPPAKFHVVDVRSAEILERTEAEHPQSHLLLGILNAEAGIRDAATRQLEQVRPTAPGADVARRSLERLRSLPQQGSRP